LVFALRSKRWVCKAAGQTFNYDALNRLTSAQNAGTDCSQTTLNSNQTKFWGNVYGYDAWGNLVSKDVTKCSAEALDVTALANNQLSGYGYDAAGNMKRLHKTTISELPYAGAQHRSIAKRSAHKNDIQQTVELL